MGKVVVNETFYRPERLVGKLVHASRDGFLDPISHCERVIFNDGYDLVGNV